MEERLLEACAEALARQIAPRAQIVDVALPARDRIDILISRGDGARARVVIDLSPERATLYLTRPLAEGGEGGGEAFRRLLAGGWIVGVDRPVPRSLVRLALQAAGEGTPGTWLIIEWLGARPDTLLIDANGREVLARLGVDPGTHAPRRAVGSIYDWPAAPRRPFYGEASPEEIRSILEGAVTGRDRARALARGCAGLPSYLALEALHRAGAIDEPVSEDRVARALRAIAAGPLEPALYIVPDHESVGVPPAFVSPIPLHSLESHRRMMEGADLSRLLERAHETALRAERRHRVRDAYRRLIDGEARRLVRLHSRLRGENDAAAEAPILRRNAEALLVHVTEIPRGASHFSCPDQYDPSRSLEIDLDPRLGAPANADLLFRRARRLERGGPLRARRLAAIDAAAARLSLLRGRVDSDTDSLARGGTALLAEALGPFSRERVLEAWKRIGAETPAPRKRPTRPVPSQSTPARRRTADARFHPRTYKTREGWTILVGRSNEENDYVTHALARPDDYWFHVHGCPGSHVVLRREGRKDNPSVRTIEETASIAAWFSKARTSKRAPIVYTLKKYVRRPRKGPAGLALITREKTILVEPKAPVDAEPGGWGDEES